MYPLRKTLQKAASPLLLACTIFLLATTLPAEEPAAQPADAAGKSLFDGASLNGWKAAAFAGAGDVEVKDGAIVLQSGESLTGVTYTGEVPTTNYEISLDAMKLAGIDFFCGLTFPVADSHCSFIVGGWSGSVTGLSSLDGNDASENETSQYMNLERNRWYHIRVRVEPERIQCWIDEERLVDQDITGHKIGIRFEVEQSKPLGVASYQTKAAIKNIRLRKLANESQ